MEEPLPKLDYLNIVRQFGINEFTITGLCMAGPDDIIGAISGPNNQYYVLWGRDYMDELEPETNTLKNEFGIIIEKWLPLREFGNDHDLTYIEKETISDGFVFALGRIKYQRPNIARCFLLRSDSQ